LIISAKTFLTGNIPTNSKDSGILTWRWGLPMRVCWFPLMSPM
jgi:hypothetical protein